MAEGILFNLAGEIIKKLSSLAFQQLGMLWGVNDDLTKLTSSVSAIKAVLLDAEERQTGSNSLQDWLGKLKEALYDAEDVLDEISYEALHREVMTVKFIDKNDPCPSSVFFPSLKTLCLENMPNLKGWWEKESTAGLRPAFPCLTTLSISNCPKLASIPEHPCLENLKLDDVGLQMMSSIGTSLDASQSSSSSSSLKSLNLKRIGDLENLPCKLRQKLTSLEYLHMEECHNLEKSLCDDHEATQWNLLHNLRVLWLWELRKLVSLPIEARHWTSLRYLIISKCPNLRSLPEWIGCLVSLHLLYIIDCPELKSLPEEMRQLKSLIAGCPDLEERCKEGGEDWPKISHVPHFSKYFYYFERGQDQDHGTANTAHASSSSGKTVPEAIRSHSEKFGQKRIKKNDQESQQN